MKLQKSTAKPVTITIRVDAGGTFTYRPEANVHLKSNQGVDWTCPDGNFAVLFKSDSPFPKAVYGGERGQTSEVAVVSEPAGSYKYSAIVVRDGVTYWNDPEIVVDEGMGGEGHGKKAGYKAPQPAKKAVKKSATKKSATKKQAGKR